MMKLFLLPMILLGIFASLAAAQHPPVVHGPSDHDSGRFRPVILGLGDTLALPDGTVLEFVELIEDSRCPADVTCIWQGQARLHFEHDGKPFILTYLSRDEATVLLGAYGLQVLDVQPYPLASQPHDPADTKVTVRLFTPTA